LFHSRKPAWAGSLPVAIWRQDRLKVWRGCTMASAGTMMRGGVWSAGLSASAAATGAEASPHAKPKREKFLPITRHALLDRLTQPKSWPAGDAVEVRRLMRYLDYWRRHSYAANLLELEQLYEPFSPDSDLLTTRAFSPQEKLSMQKQVVEQMRHFLVQANFEHVDASDVKIILTKDSYYGLDLQVDLGAFEEILIFYRGATTMTERRRTAKRLFLWHEDVEVPVFQRLFLLFKLKPFEVRVGEVMREHNLARKEAEKFVKRTRGLLPGSVKSDFIYMKLFKNIPRTDIEMIFPNTKVQFRLFDKIKFGVTAGSGLGMGVVGTVGKIALVSSNPLALLGALAGLGGVAMRQASAFINQRNRYMIVMAQNLYFHAVADNRGVMTLLADRAAEEDVKEEMLLYSALAKEPVNMRDLKAVDEAIEAYLKDTFALDVDFDISDALGRLKQDGLVSELADGSLRALPPHAAAKQIDKLWDQCLDQLPDPPVAGHEFDGATGGPAAA
jgi:Protein of unknown function (DUF3754)